MKKLIPAFDTSPIIPSSPDQMLCLLANRPEASASHVKVANRPEGSASLILIGHLKMSDKVKNSVWPPKLNEIRDSRAVGHDVRIACGVQD